MDLLKTYLTAIDFSQNALKSIIHRYKIQTFLDIDSIPITVAEDLFFKMQEENKVFSVQEIACFCKYHTLHLATCDRKHKCQSINPYADIQEKPILYKKTAKSVASLRKIDLIKEFTLQGKKNEEIMQITGFARSTVSYLQKQAGVKCVNSRIQYTEEQVEYIKKLSVDFTAKGVGEKLGLTEKRVRAIAAQEGIHFYHIGGAPKRSKIKNEDEILELYSQGMSGLQIAKRLGINPKTVYKVKQKKEKVHEWERNEANRHVKFCKEFMQKLNVEMARINGWIHSKEEAKEAFGYTDKEINQYWNGNLKIGIREGKKLLGLPEK